MNNNTFIFLLLMQGSIFCSDQEEINPFEGYSIEEIALRFNYTKIEKGYKAYQKEEIVWEETTHYFTELKDINKYYKARNTIKNIIFPGFYFFGQHIKEIFIFFFLQNYKQNCIKENGEEFILPINNTVSLYALIEKPGRCFKKSFLFLKDNNNKIIPLKINDMDTDYVSSCLASSSNKDFKLNQNTLTFIRNDWPFNIPNNFIDFIMTSLSKDNFEAYNQGHDSYIRLTPPDLEIDELKAKEEVKQFKNIMQRMVFLLSLILAYKYKNISIKSLLFLPKLLSELYYQQSWESMWQESAQHEKNDAIKKSEYDSLQNLLKLAQKHNDPELMKKYEEYKIKLDKKYAQ